MGYERNLVTFRVACVGFALFVLAEASSIPLLFSARSRVITIVAVAAGIIYGVFAYLPLAILTLVVANMSFDWLPSTVVFPPCSSIDVKRQVVLQLLATIGGIAMWTPIIHLVQPRWRSRPAVRRIFYSVAVASLVVTCMQVPRFDLDPEPRGWTSIASILAIPTEAALTLLGFRDPFTTYDVACSENAIRGASEYFVLTAVIWLFVVMLVTIILTGGRKCIERLPG